MQKIHASSTAYIKSLNKRSEGDSRDKQTPVAYFGSTLTKHGQDFEDDNRFGACLAGTKA
jgi:hypothetical protein